MRIRTLTLSCGLLLLLAWPDATPTLGVARAAEPAPAELGQPAPDFTLTGTDGRPFHLADLKGKRVVLEWFNPDCPFVRHAHTQGPLKDQGNRAAQAGVVWVAINSGAPGKQGAGLARSQSAVKEYGISYPVLIDESGQVGRRYGAKSTPHMYLINEKGVLVYRGAIDNAPLGAPEGGGGGAVVNHVEAALRDVQAGKPVKTPETKPYGCSVKYGS